MCAVIINTGKAAFIRWRLFALARERGRWVMWKPLSHLPPSRKNLSDLFFLETCLSVCEILIPLRGYSQPRNRFKESFGIGVRTCPNAGSFGVQTACQRERRRELRASLSPTQQSGFGACPCGLPSVGQSVAIGATQASVVVLLPHSCIRFAPFARLRLSPFGRTLEGVRCSA
jgi:hypothetical protein